MRHNFIANSVQVVDIPKQHQSTSKSIITTQSCISVNTFSRKRRQTICCIQTALELIVCLHLRQSFTKNIILLAKVFKLLKILRTPEDEIEFSEETENAFQHILCNAQNAIQCHFNLFKSPLLPCLYTNILYKTYLRQHLKGRNAFVRIVNGHFILSLFL